MQSASGRMVRFKELMSEEIVVDLGYSVDPDTKKQWMFVCQDSKW